MFTAVSDFKVYVGKSANSVRQSIDRMLLERELADITNSVRGHKTAGAKAGSQVYKTLYTKANSKILAFTRKYDISYQDVIVQMSVIVELEKLANPVPMTKQGKIALCIAVPALFVLLCYSSGFICGAIHWCFLHGYHVLGR